MGASDPLVGWVGKRVEIGMTDGSRWRGILVEVKKRAVYLYPPSSIIGVVKYERDRIAYVRLLEPPFTKIVFRQPEREFPPFIK